MSTWRAYSLYTDTNTRAWSSRRTKRGTGKTSLAREWILGSGGMRIGCRAPAVLLVHRGWQPPPDSTSAIPRTPSALKG